MPQSVLVLNGPNLNLLGSREPEIYGSETLADIAKLCAAAGKRLGLAVDFRQSNSESELVGWIQEARGKKAGILINAGAYTHTSVALLDALLASELPVIEVHLSNLFKREEFRHHSYITRAARGMICGLGSQGYTLALEAMARIVGDAPAKPKNAPKAKRTK
ncbi:MAG TPA: type II 3-dehydroquinate dehydratase [Alphaproteobacteria bacterium]|nr:type II 3-dehydroquinate dehydratase [Alphaproteobacteria bacterium]